MKEQQRIKIGENTPAIYQYQQGLKQTKKDIQRAIAIYHATGVAVPLNDNELSTFLNDAEAFINARIDAIEIGEINSIKIQKDAYLNLIGVSFTDVMKKELKQIKHDIIARKHTINTFNLTNGTIEENTNATADFIEAQTLYAKTEHEIAVYNLLTCFRDSCNALNQYHIKEGRGNLHPMYFKLSDFLEQREPNSDYIVTQIKYENLLKNIWR